MAGLAQRLQLDFRREGDRFAARRQICGLLEPWFADHNSAEIQARFDRAGVLWGPYQTFKELVASDPRCSLANPLFAEVEQPEIGRVLTAGSPLRFSAQPGPPPAPAPRLGQHTDEVLHDLAGVGAAELASLRAAGVIG